MRFVEVQVMVECITNWRTPDIPMKLNQVYSSKINKQFKRTIDGNTMTLELGDCPVCGDVKVCFFTGNASKVQDDDDLYTSTLDNESKTHRPQLLLFVCAMSAERAIVLVLVQLRLSQ
jgi:hypothetical protein